MLSVPVSSWRIVTSGGPPRVAPTPVLFYVLFNDLDEGEDTSPTNSMMMQDGGVLIPGGMCRPLE